MSTRVRVAAVVVVLASIACSREGNVAPHDTLPPLAPIGPVSTAADAGATVDAERTPPGAVAAAPPTFPQAPACTKVKLVLEHRAAADDPMGHFKATLVNEGKEALVLVMPGDGSDVGWRTPKISWEILAGTKRTTPGGRCGNMNRITAADVFELAPAAKQDLGGWLGWPELAPGAARVRLVYENDGDIGSRSLALGEDDEVTIARIKASSRCKVTSNAVSFVVK